MTTNTIMLLETAKMGEGKNGEMGELDMEMKMEMGMGMGWE